MNVATGDLDRRLTQLEQRFEHAGEQLAGAALALQEFAAQFAGQDDPQSLHRMTEAKLVALEAVLVHLIAPVLVAAAPAQTLRAVKAMRSGLKITARPGSEFDQLVCEEHVQHLADRIERKLTDTG